VVDPYGGKKKYSSTFHAAKSEGANKMFLETLIKLIISISFVFTIIILNFTIFRIPIKNNDREIALLALAVGSTNFYFKFVLAVPYFMLIQTFVYMILLMVLRRYPILYSFIVSIVGSLCVSIIDGLITIAALQTGISDLDLMANDIRHYIYFHLFTMSVLLLASLAVYKLNIGFSFVIRRFKDKRIKLSDIIWGITLAMTILILQFGTQHLKFLSFHGVIITLLTAALISVMVHAYIQNSKVKKDRFGG
jgi:hypothetical protein